MLIVSSYCIFKNQLTSVTAVVESVQQWTINVCVVSILAPVFSFEARKRKQERISFAVICSKPRLLWFSPQPFWTEVQVVKNVQEHVPERVPVHPVQHRQQATADMGQEGPERPHQEDHGPWHPELRSGDRRHQREHHLHHLSGRPAKDPRHQASLPRHDRQKHEEIFHLRSSGSVQLNHSFVPSLFLSFKWRPLPQFSPTYK